MVDRAPASALPSPPEMVQRLIASDSFLGNYERALLARAERVAEMRRSIVGDGPLAEFASGHEYFGVHRVDGRWIIRERAPNATSIHLKGDFTNWEARPEYAFTRLDGGVWELVLDAEKLGHDVEYRLEVAWEGGRGDRLPAWVRRVVYDEASNSFNAAIWDPPEHYVFQHESPPRPRDPLLVYETHVGMAQEEGKVGTFAEFTRDVLPRIHAAGYGAIQIMALAEHPYYASFGYQVSNFFAASSRYGTPNDLKELIDRAHELGLVVLMDVVHSHAVRNEVEGISHQDGSGNLYFHAGPRGEHEAWGSRVFDYGKHEVLHFLLSNCRYWMDEYRVDGFRFDGVTSMLYLDHGLSRVFTSYDDYFGLDVDVDALGYLTLANELVHELKPDAVTVAEEVSGYPALARPRDQGGVGFDYRYAMGVPDHWIVLTKETRDEDWSMGELWHELTNRRWGEPTISYAESHDQAMVGDQTLIFRLLGPKMYDQMATAGADMVVDRGIALHKMIRLATLGTAGHGYLNFMGNEFGHPEWLDFPREGNDWSYHYARRQWSLADDHTLRYPHLGRFDRDLMALAKRYGVPHGDGAYGLMVDEDAKVIAWLRETSTGEGPLLFVTCFHPERSYTDFRIPAPPGTFEIVLDTDRSAYGGFERRDPGQRHHALPDRIQRHFLSLYLPSRTAMVLAPVPPAG